MKRTLAIVLLTGLLALVSCSRGSGRRTGKRDHCQLSPDPGTCRASIPKWYYDSSSGNCKNFTYGGCRGNSNKFDSKSDCERTCKHSGCKYQTCSRTCPNGFIIDADGCNTCRCQPGPEQASCPEIECPTSCPQGYQTDTDGCMMCDCLAEPVQTRASNTSSQHLCPPVCYMFCPYGNKQDENGCDICLCNSKEEVCGSEQCLMECPTGFVTDGRGCELCECKSAEDVQSSCPTNVCFKECAFGFQKDSFGCAVCVCATSRDRHSQATDCSSRPKCAMFCPNGFVKGRDGCEICRCDKRSSGRRLGRVERRFGQKRVSAEDACGIKPMCSMFCPDGFQKDRQGCDICACRQNSLVRDSAAQQPTTNSSQLPAQIPVNIPSQQPDDSSNPISAPRAGCSIKRCHRTMTCSFGFAKDEDGCDACVCSSSKSRPASKRRGSQ